ncbi:MAG: hypothetical protein HQ507_00540 [Candidatus Marinimicrobia bacterium]|nr:hypothetical protein [Candidatus Neomarinimicrobiota bacterium]
MTNFSKSNAIEFEKQWERIRDTILSVFDLIISFGFTESTLTSKNALIPIIYYLYHCNLDHSFNTRVEFIEDRANIKKWLHASLVKRLFGGTSDNVLSQIRKAFTEDVTKTPIPDGLSHFPVDTVNSQLKKDSGISDEFIEELLMTQKDNKYAFSLLALLFPNLDFKNNNFHKDHLHPENSFSVLTEDLGVKIDWKEYNSLKNLQMLDANENMSKNAESLDIWVEKETRTKDRTSFLINHHIPDVDLGLDNFIEYLAKRSDILKAQLKELLT